MSSGNYVTMGDKLGTTYPQRGDAMWDLVEDFYNGAYATAISKSAGSAVYTTDFLNGYHNAIYGKYITAAMFMNDNIFTAIGARPYQHEGVRIATEAASYGLATERDIQMGLTDFAPEDFIGIGATTIQDGYIPDSIKLPVTEFRQPFKDLTLSYDYGLGLAALESKDDTIQKKDYVDKISRNFSDLLDKSLLRPIENPQPVLNGIETSLNGIHRLLSGYSEIGRTVNGKTIDEGMVSPYGGRTASRGDFYNYRANGETNLDANVIDMQGKTLSLEAMRLAYRTAAVNWADSASPNNKIWAMSNIAEDKLGALMQANQVLLDTVFVQRDFNGVKTMPGRDMGLYVNTYNKVPIIHSGNLNFDYSKKKVSTTKMGDISLIDLDHIWMSILTPVALYSNANPSITRKLQELNVIHMRAETRIDSFIQHSRLVGLQDDTL